MPACLAQIGKERGRGITRILNLAGASSTTCNRRRTRGACHPNTFQFLTGERHYPAFIRKSLEQPFPVGLSSSLAGCADMSPATPPLTPGGVRERRPGHAVEPQDPPPRPRPPPRSPRRPRPEPGHRQDHRDRQGVGRSAFVTEAATTAVSPTTKAEEATEARAIAVNATRR